MRTFIFFLILFLGVYNQIIISQKTEELFIPKEIKKAYEKGTRSYSGNPGENYFQNTTDYLIKAEFIPENRTINGTETITYTNNSPDSLSDIYLKLYQDLFKKGSARDWDLGPVDIHDGVVIKLIKINDISVDLTSGNINRRATIMSIHLDNKILPKSKNIIEIEWSLVIPGNVPVRMGTYYGNNYFIGYWYPKMAVYDDVVGWNTVPHTGFCEYYNEYGNFDVEITVPDGYNVWSTGLLQNADEIYTDKYLERIKKAAISDEVIQVITKEDRAKNDITKEAEKHIWKFKAKNRPDFAFAVSNQYLWDATSVKVGNNRVLIHTVYYEKSKDFYKVADLSRKSIDFFSTQSPKIKYPYPQLVAFNNSRGGGMEFPGMVNDGDASNPTRTIYLTAHEIGHTYFPFYVGTNEQKYAWVDEGLISFFPRKVAAKYTDEKNFSPYQEMVDLYNKSAGSELEVPMMISSTNTGPSYRFHAYVRPSVAFYTLHELLGEEKFNQGLQKYTEIWNGKHPTPFDLFNIFNQVAGEDLGWFWKPWFFELGYADLAFGNMKIKKKTKTIEIVNKGGFPVQVNLKVLYSNGDLKEIKRKADVWKQGNKTINIELPEGEIKELILDNVNTPDAFPENNFLILQK